MKTKKTVSEKGARASATSKKPKAVTTKKPERTVSSKTATSTAGPKKGKTLAKPQPPTSEEVYTKISKLAYELYEQRGWHQGQDMSDWLDAERQVFTQEPLATTLDR